MRSENPEDKFGTEKGNGKARTVDIQKSIPSLPPNQVPSDTRPPADDRKQKTKKRKRRHAEDAMENIGQQIPHAGRSLGTPNFNLTPQERLPIGTRPNGKASTGGGCFAVRMPSELNHNRPAVPKQQRIDGAPATPASTIDGQQPETENTHSRRSQNGRSQPRIGLDIIIDLTQDEEDSEQEQPVRQVTVSATSQDLPCTAESSRPIPVEQSKNYGALSPIRMPPRPSHGESLAVGPPADGVSVTPAPTASIPIALASVDSAPVTSAQVGLAPITPASIIPAPVTPAAFISAPVTPIAAALDPVTPSIEMDSGKPTTGADPQSGSRNEEAQVQMEQATFDNPAQDGDRRSQIQDVGPAEEAASRQGAPHTADPPHPTPPTEQSEPYTETETPPSQADLTAQQPQVMRTIVQEPDEEDLMLIQREWAVKDQILQNKDQILQNRLQSIRGEQQLRAYRKRKAVPE